MSSTGLLILDGIYLSIPVYWVPWPAKRKSLPDDVAAAVENFETIFLIIIIRLNGLSSLAHLMF